jgi:hypothetical protein
MKSILRIALAATVLAGASSLYALTIPASGSIEIAATPNADPAGGGEFAVKIGTHDFLSFCVERYEDLTIHLPGTFNYVLNDDTTTTGNTISRGTAWLFSQFADGALVGYDFGGAGRPANAAALQKAIWTLEDEGSPNNAFTTLVKNKFGSLVAAKVDSTNVGVKVLQIWQYNEEKQREELQDILVRVPDSGITLAFLGVPWFYFDRSSTIPSPLLKAVFRHDFNSQSASLSLALFSLGLILHLGL